MIRLMNSQLQASMDPLGAELRELKAHGRDYLWSGDPAWWGKCSPVLFPIVGTLKDNHYHYGGTTHTLPRHGFARDKVFEARQLSDTEAVFTMEDDEATRIAYPFRFLLRLRYLLVGNRLTVTYTVINTGDAPLFFSLGAHPAFAVPLMPESTYDDHYLEFETEETAGRWELKDGLLTGEVVPFLEHQRRIPLTKGLFASDAIVLKGLKSRSLSLRNDKDDHGLRFGIEGWPHLGIWAAKDADFVCIEPWQGHADPVSHDGRLERKPGMLRLAPAEDWENSWWVELF
jgi:galactose mutarotase-like enzyme